MARKLGRHYLGVELVEEFALLAEWRLRQAEQEPAIQGYAEGVFWERNTLNVINGRGLKTSAKPNSTDELTLLL